MPRKKLNNENESMRRTLHNYLQRRALTSPPIAAGDHLDEDHLAAFTEGRLSEQEAKPLITHLVDCASCRRITARLIRLEEELGDSQTATSTPAQEEPGRIRRLLENLASRVIPSSEDTVFAYHAPAEDFEKKDDLETSKDPEDETKSNNKE
jgi:hypothetical protein